MKKTLFAIALFSGLFMVSCKSKDGDPKAVLAEFFDALGKKDMAKARTFSTESSKSMLDIMEMGLNMSKDSSMDLKYNASNLKYGEVKIEGDKATVPVTEISTNETTNYSLKKEKGAWKVAFDKESLMKTGMEKMNEEGINPRDSMMEGLEQLENMDKDSLKAKVNESLQMLDSLKSPE